jgi:hypothetical protein
MAAIRPGNGMVKSHFAEEAFDYIMQIPATLPTGTGAADLLTEFVMPHDFELLEVGFVVSVVGTGAGASRAFNVEIGTADVTGALTLLLADTTPVGKVTKANLTALNTGSAGDTVSLEVASGGTAFTAGSGWFFLKVRNRSTSMSPKV